MSANSLAMSLMQLNQIDWPATAGMLTVISIVAGGAGALIAALVVKPMIEKAIQDAMRKTISKEAFENLKEDVLDHLDNCDRIDKHELQMRLERAEKEIDRHRNFSHWIVNSLMLIGGKLDIKLPERPFS